MTATNHALTGALIGLVVGQPLIAVPAALASHFVCDSLPHYKRELPGDELLKSGWFQNYLIIDCSLCVLLVLVLALLQPHHWLLASICAFLATSPDLVWLEKYLKVRSGRAYHENSFAKFSRVIQWFQRPIGWSVEAAWFVGALVLISPFLR